MTARVLATSDPSALADAVEILEAGGLVVLPTDTVYGVGAMAFDPEAVARLYRVKGRPESKAIPILIGDPQDLTAVAGELSGAAESLAARFWPGAMTLVVPRRPELPEEVSSYGTVGVRMPDHEFARALMTVTGPLAVTSANPSGGPNAHSAQAALEALGKRVDLILDGGKSPGGQPSTVVDCSVFPPKILRQGPISAAEIDEVLGLPHHPDEYQRR